MKMESILRKLMKAGIEVGKEACIAFWDEINDQLDADNNNSVTDDLVKKEIYIDTCSFMHQGADKFFLKYVPMLEHYGKKINTLSCCIKEIEKHLSSDEYDTRFMAQRAKGYIDNLIRAGLLNVVDYSDDVFADADFIAVFTKKRIKEEILFITQDGNLSVDVYQLNKMRSIKGNNITVKAIDDDGELITNSRLKEYMDFFDEEDEYDDEKDYAWGQRGFVCSNSGGVNIMANEISIDNREFSKEDNHENERRPEHRTWESIGRRYESVPNADYKYCIDGVEVDENVVVKLYNDVNNAIAAGEPIYIHRW